MKFKFLIILFTVSFASCTGNNLIQKEESEDKTKVSKTIIPDKDQITTLELDSLKIENFIASENIEKETASRIREFYMNRDFQFAWFSEEGLTESAQWFWDLHEEYVVYTQDSSSFDEALHQEIEALMDGEEGNSQQDATKIEMQLTAHFLHFSKYAFTGKINPSQLQWHIPRKKLNPVALLDSLVRNEGEFDDLVPQSRQYRSMREQLKIFGKLKENYPAARFTLEGKSLRMGDSSSILPMIRSALFTLGDLKNSGSSPFFDKELEDAVISYQDRHGLIPDGIIGRRVIGELNVPISDRIEKMLINMERMRWMPEQPEGRSIIANIPEFRIRVFEGSEEALAMNIVVGKAANRTVIFKDELEYVVFSPYWNVPRSITRNEIVPAMRRNGNYLAQNNMEIVRYSGGLPVIRQKPGPQNALGKVKFIFPNRYSIYFHDTPAKSLFERTRRAFSHGCIRLENPFAMAKYLLNNNSSWTDERIRSQMNADREKWVKLENKVPVRIVYFTSWVDKNGKINFRDDIYGHDKKLAAQLFK